MTTDVQPAALTPDQTSDSGLRRRAAVVVPGGMYGHLAMGGLPGHPQFIDRARGARLWDVDGHEYVDLMGSWGPVVLGHHDPVVEAAAARQRARGDCLNGPAEVMVDLAELLVRVVDHADWAMFAKNGTDATTMCCTIARAATGRRLVLVADGAYHGAAPWCSPNPVGTTGEDRANLRYYRYNDLDSLRTAVEDCADDLAAVIVSAFRHDAGFDQELADPEFARGARALCDATGAALVLDDVRAGFRLHHGSSWQPLGVRPDLAAWSKAIANGYPLAAVTGGDAWREAAGRIFVTGSFWMGAVPMAAAHATVTELGRRKAVEHMVEVGEALRAGVLDSACRWGVEVRYTGPVQMPTLLFADDPDHALARSFCAEASTRGVYVHPQHNWFVSAATTPADLDMALTGLDGAFAAVGARTRR